MNITRRAFLGSAASAGIASGCRSLVGSVPRHRSDYDGVRIGAITYSFAKMPGFPKGCTKGFILAAGLGSVELMDRDFERDLGIVPFRHIHAKHLTKAQKVAISCWRETAEMKPLEDFPHHVRRSWNRHSHRQVRRYRMPLDVFMERGGIHVQGNSRSWCARHHA